MYKKDNSSKFEAISKQAENMFDLDMCMRLQSNGLDHAEPKNGDRFKSHDVEHAFLVALASSRLLAIQA